MLCMKAGQKNIGTVFLLTDAQVPEESFLVLINDLLASGEIPGLYADDEVENIIGGLRNEVKGAGLQDTRENCWKFFIERVRRNLKVLNCAYHGSSERIIRYITRARFDNELFAKKSPWLYKFSFLYGCKLTTFRYCFLIFDIWRVLDVDFYVTLVFKVSSGMFKGYVLPICYFKMMAGYRAGNLGFSFEITA